LRLGYRATRDAGTQALARTGTSSADFKLALRPSADPGTQSVSLGTSG
jgi:hypothetical protein